jgi:ribosomal subunit interface protein
MLKKLEISSINSKLDSKTHSYIDNKLGNLDKVIPPWARESAHMELHLKKNKTRGNKFVCKVILYLPNKMISVSESAVSFEAAIDLIEDKLKANIRKYKELHSGHKTKRHHQNYLMKAY